MKKIMLVISDIEKSHALLKKAIKLLPDHLTVLLANANPDDQALISDKFASIKINSNLPPSSAGNGSRLIIAR